MSSAFPDHRPARHGEPWPSTITVVPWRDPLIERIPGAIPTVSDDVLVWWTNTLGPSAVLLARHLATYAADGASVWSLEDLAGSFGISRSVVAHTLDRLVRFGVVARHGSTVEVRLMLGPLSARQRERLPRYLAEAYRAS
jgi:hypothetical protein